MASSWSWDVVVQIEQLKPEPLRSLQLSPLAVAAAVSDGGYR